MRVLSLGGLACCLALACEAAKVPRCVLKNCALKSPLAWAGPGFLDGVRFFAAAADGKDTRETCPFGGGDDEKEPSKEEYMRYMKGLDKVGDMSPDERRAWALKNEDKWNDQAPSERKVKEPSVDVTKPGVELVNGKTWSELRAANKFDFLITFYAPWCPYCKRFVKGENAPIKALSAALEKVDGPKVVKFDMINSSPPLTIDAVPMVYLFKITGEALTFEGNHEDLDGLMAWALDNASPKEKAKEGLLEKEVSPHLRGLVA